MIKTEVRGGEMIKLSPKEVSRQAAYLVWALASALNEAWARSLFDENGTLQGFEDLADIWTSEGGEWARSLPTGGVIRVTQGGFFHLGRGGLSLLGKIGRGVALEDWERDWGHYAILKDLLLSAIAHLEDKEEAAEALALLSNALSALEEGEKKKER